MQLDMARFLLIFPQRCVLGDEGGTWGRLTGGRSVWVPGGPAG